MSVTWFDTWSRNPSLFGNRLWLVDEDPVLVEHAVRLLSEKLGVAPVRFEGFADCRELLSLQPVMPSLVVVGPLGAVPEVVPVGHRLVMFGPQQPEGSIRQVRCRWRRSEINDNRGFGFPAGRVGGDVNAERKVGLLGVDGSRAALLAQAPVVGALECFLNRDAGMFLTARIPDWSRFAAGLRDSLRIIRILTELRRRKIGLSAAVAEGLVSMGKGAALMKFRDKWNFRRIDSCLEALVLADGIALEGSVVRARLILLQVWGERSGQV